MSGEVFLDRYRVVRPIGEGSMGQVYLAREIDTGREVAVKVMHEAIAAQPKFRELFETEMELMSQFQHPNVVGVIEAAAQDPRNLCLVMEYVPGTDLEGVLRDTGRLSVERTLHILGQLCAALEAAHAENIVHRDLKPANLMVMYPGRADETVKVMDFGLAKLNDAFYISLDKLRGDSSDIATGTAEYMAPEQVRGDAMDQRGDLYSVGVMLYEMLTGKLPFDMPTIPELLLAHAEDPVPDFATKGIRDVPAEVEKVVHWAMAKYPNERPQTAWELAKKFEKAAALHVLPDRPEPARASGARRTPAVPVPGMIRDADVREMEAFMPERIAVVKLRGFVDDAGGEMVESVPGKIRIHFGQDGCRYQMSVAKGGLLGWLHLTRRQIIEVELRMRKVEAANGNQLHITEIIRAADGGPMPRTPRWQAICDKIYRDLRGYLMSK